MAAGDENVIELSMLGLKARAAELVNKIITRHILFTTDNRCAINDYPDSIPLVCYPIIP